MPALEGGKVFCLNVLCWGPFRNVCTRKQQQRSLRYVRAKQGGVRRVRHIQLTAACAVTTPGSVSKCAFQESAASAKANIRVASLFFFFFSSTCAFVPLWVWSILEVFSTYSSILRYSYVWIRFWKLLLEFFASWTFLFHAFVFWNGVLIRFHRCSSFALVSQGICRILAKFSLYMES